MPLSARFSWLIGVCVEVTAAVAIVVSFSITAARAQTAYAISGFQSDTLIRFDVKTPNDVTIVGKFSGATSILTGLDFRVSDGLLYGYRQSTVPQGNYIVTVDVNTAATTLVSIPTVVSSTPFLGVGFDPVADTLRLVNTNDQNQRINTATGVTTVDTTLAYAPGDVNFGINPNVIETAYTNKDLNQATGTDLYYIDYVAGTLVRTDNANDGVLHTVGSLGVGSINNAFVGFDIYSREPSVNIGYATLIPTSGVPSLYTIDLRTGTASLVGRINTSGAPFQLAIQPGAATAAAPEPSAFALLAPVLPLVTLLRRRNR